MADTFNSRERAQENKFMHDEELRFKAQVGAVKEVAKWCVELANNEGPFADGAEEYAKALVQIELVEHGMDGVSEKIFQNLQTVGIDKPHNVILAKLKEETAVRLEKLKADQA